MGAAIGTGSAGSRVILSRIQFAGLVTDQERETQRAARGWAGQQATASRPSRPSRPGMGYRHPTLEARWWQTPPTLWRPLCKPATLRRCDPGPGQRVTLHGCIPSHGIPKPSQDKTGSRGQPCRWEPPKLSRTITHVLYPVRTGPRHPGTGPTPSSAGSGSGKRCCSRSRSDEGQATRHGQRCSSRISRPVFRLEQAIKRKEGQAD